MIVFTLRSRDQGWGGNPEDRGSYRSSWTWFDAGLEKFEGSYESDEAHSADSGLRPAPNFSPDNLRTVWPELQLGLSGETYEFHHDLQPNEEHKIQANILAEKSWQTHQVIWSWTDNIEPSSPRAEELQRKGRGRSTGNGEFVRHLTVGDVVTIWARARFPGWINWVERAQVDIYWAL